jgi:dTMP kinase
MTWYAIDGMDGSGKTTSSDFIREQLTEEGRKVLEITHPNQGTPYGRKAAKYLLRDGKAAVMVSTFYYILDVLHSLRVKRKHGKEYDDIIFVRYSLAAAYLPERLCRLAYKLIEFMLPIPDVKIYVDVEPKIALERIYARGEELEMFETEEKLEKTRRRMRMITGSWTTVDNSGPPEGTREQTRKILQQVRGDRDARSQP